MYCKCNFRAINLKKWKVRVIPLTSRVAIQRCFHEDPIAKAWFPQSRLCHSCLELPSLPYLLLVHSSSETARLPPPLPIHRVGRSTLTTPRLSAAPSMFPCSLSFWGVVKKGCGFFAYSWKLPAYNGAFLLTIDNFSFFTYSWSFFAYNFSFFTYSWSFFLTVGKCV